MPNCVASGAQISCSYGSAPASLVVLPLNQVMETTPGANVNDYIPFVNIPAFGSCSCSANPAVAAATAAAQGTLTPAPCIPATAQPWSPGNPLVLLAGNAILTDDSQTLCSYGGQISITDAGQEKALA